MLTHAPVSLHRTYRLVTRSDFDGLVCAALLRELGLLDEVLFVHPKDVQDGKVELSDGDITTNLPYRPEVALAFDHHSSERRRVVEDSANRVIVADARSAARVVFDYFGGAERFPRVSAEMMEAVDRADAALLDIEDIHVLWGLRRQNTVFAVGRSILDRSSQLDIGALMLAHAGGGHQAAGTCQIANERAEAVLAELIETITRAEDEPPEQP